MVNCDFCKEIYDYDNLSNMSLLERCESLIPGNVIEHRESDNSYGIWNECSDSYYSGRIMKINYCPVCGRKLNMNHKVER